MIHPRRASLLVAFCAPICLAACTSSGGSNPAKDLARSAGMTGGEAKPAPDFIEKSRSQTLDYIPTTSSEPVRNPRRKTVGEVSNAEAEMEALRSRNERRGASARRAAGN